MGSESFGWTRRGSRGIDKGGQDARDSSSGNLRGLSSYTVLDRYIDR